MRARVAIAAALTVVLAATVLVLLQGSRGHVVAAGPDGPAPVAAPDLVAGGDRPVTGVRPVLSRQPNIVLVLMDDFSMDLLQTMRSARRMAREGASYEHSFAVDSLCCVSRSSLMTGQFPHQTGVLTNTANTPNEHGPIGGWEAFEAYGNEARSVNVRLQEAGYTTGFIGKFLNQYEVRDGVAPEPPAGWDDWRVIFGSAYDGWDFQSTEVVDGEVVLRHHPLPWAWASDEEKDAGYVGSVTQEMALEFLRERRGETRPFFLQVAPYAPHARVGPVGAFAGDPMFPPAFRDRPRPGQPLGNCGAVPCRRLDVRDLPGFADDQADNAPRYADGSPAADWRGEEPVVTAPSAAGTVRNRARMVQSIDRMVTRILDEVDDDTYVLLTSDNGFHVGQHGLGRGKGTPFDSDVRVPLLVVGPGVEPGTRSEVVSNLDLAPTFEDLAGIESPRYRAGTSLVPTLVDPAVDRRDLVFLEHTWAPSLGFDPDKSYAGGTMDRVPSYVAVRGRDALLVRYDLDPSWEGVDHAWEFYDYRDAAWERTNTVADRGDRPQVRRLRRALEQFDSCRRVTRDEPFPTRCRELTGLVAG